MENGATPAERHEACGETFFENSPFFTRGGKEVRFSILREWTLRHSRRGCHVTILRPPRMGGKRLGVTTPTQQSTLDKSYTYKR
jgi:hypothetical protein